MEVIKRGITPDCIDIQVEDWSVSYSHIYDKKDVLAAYPDDVRGVYPRIRIAFQFDNSDEAAKAFESLASGDKKIVDFEKYCTNSEIDYVKKYFDYMRK
ncbi:hypothetical protein [uncultured Anaerococcus sp.]|uniref:hypothetical protein n=1 Tax=uncultured Anaerococcus sp. TaxID=293428 RepID=UPI0028890195|nr:hypothetical protein [uncultured Anaerococcus sp.]